MGLEVQYSDETSFRLGLCDDSVVKLTLCLSLQGIYSSTVSDDAIQSIRVGKSCSSDVLAIELWTTNRVFMIGEIEEGRAAHFEFPAAMIYAFSHHDRYMAPVVGFAIPNEQYAGAVRNGFESRPIQTISFSPEPHHGGFSSRGKLSGIVGIIAYSRTDPPESLSGIALATTASPL
ncbi:hypothetical protein PHISCL_02600 [Aspergillus sclerotialis]|uniref:Uncharacterized protein n=1 Tax=Aspergillus sclerotialis TaxID=2070753 RepID=A0A3A3A4Y3_9EURO|nr:hypothetical protein PHISCL_02600 [Aspergillus sclerotialis]